MANDARSSSDDREFDLFTRAQRLPPEARRPFVEREAGQDHRLRDGVLALLGADGGKSASHPGGNTDPEATPARDPQVGPQVTLSLPGQDKDPAAWQPYLDQLRSRGPAFLRYVFHGEVARGGMGVVHRVFDQDARRHLALKVLLGDEGPAADGQPTPPKSPVDSRSLGRFLEEAQVTSQLDHPGIVPVHEIGVDGDGRVYFTMKLVKGETLKDVFRRVADGDPDWPLSRALALVLRVCEAMSYAHVKGVLHRDLKPANVMVGRFGEVYVMDWGLARVLGHTDRKDLRVRPPREESVSHLRTDRSAPERDDIESPLFTRDGDVVGTPAYMPPEQAKGLVAQLGPGADIYSVGAMLYHLVAGHPPYCKDQDARISPHTLLAMVIHGAPEALHSIAPRAPGELVAVIERAMARQPADRYPSMAAFADDLRAFLDQRVVAAYRTGALAELSKWVQRNKALAATAAAALIAVLALSGWALVERGNAKTNERTARAETARADGNATLAEQRADDAEARKAEFDQLAGVVLLRKAEESESDLYPAWPDKVAEMERWLREDWGRVVELRPQLARTVADLEARALPQTDEQRRADREGHPKYVAYQASLRKVESLRRAQAVRDGSEPVDAALPAELIGASAQELNDYAWPRVTPDLSKRVFGEEAEALVSARAALAPSRDAVGSPDPSLLDTLAWALLANGQDDAAREASRRAEESAPEESRAEFSGYRPKLEGAIASAAETLSAAEADLAALEAEVSSRQTWEFATDAESFLHTTLSDLGQRVDAFAGGTAADVGRRLDWARRIEELTMHHPKARATWEQARAAIAAADGEQASTLYREHPIDLKPQMGLVPIGMNPVTKLWEFYHLRSACDLAAGEDPAAVTIPAHQEDGTIRVEDGTGIVFVLIPGGTFWMGAQSTDETAPNYDPGAQPDESPVREITLSPFFLARHELTQGQWRSLARETPSFYGPRNYLTGWNRAGLEAGWTHPVEQVSHDDCTLWLLRIGLLLPTEAQWEYGARAGTETPWWRGKERGDLNEAGNVADSYALDNGGGSWVSPELDVDDGNTVHARVGSYLLNAFGLYDTIGNVWEWCRDGKVDYRVDPRPGDGLREHGGTPYRQLRGGAFSNRPADSRSAYRMSGAPRGGIGNVGARSARVLQP